MADVIVITAATPLWSASVTSTQVNKVVTTATPLGTVTVGAFEI